MRAPGSILTWTISTVLALAVAGGCGSDSYPIAGSGPSGFAFGGDARVKPGPFDPTAGVPGGTRGTLPTPSTPSPPAATAGSDGGPGAFKCGTIVCTSTELCLLQASIDPNLAPAAVCQIIPADCSTCDCAKPLDICACTQLSTGGMVVSCP